MTITMKELLAKTSAGITGPEERPNKPPFGETPDPGCSRCHGTGYVYSQKYKWCVCACCRAEAGKINTREQCARELRSLETIGLVETDLALTWADVKSNFSDGWKAVEAIRPAFERGYGLIFLWGTYGQAKTLVGKILVSLAYRAGKRAAYANFMDALDNIRMAFDDPEHKTTELVRRIDWWTERDVLFLDEFDKCNDTPWAVERKFQIVDRCYTRAIREEALTVIASNKGDDEVDGYIRSRLKDKRLGPIVHLDGSDGRQFMPEGRKI